MNVGILNTIHYTYAYLPNNTIYRCIYCRTPCSPAWFVNVFVKWEENFIEKIIYMILSWSICKTLKAALQDDMGCELRVVTTMEVGTTCFTSIVIGPNSILNLQLSFSFSSMTTYLSGKTVPWPGTPSRAYCLKHVVLWAPLQHCSLFS